MDRRAILGVMAAVAVLAAVVGWAAGQRIKSPAQVAAEKAPPPPSLITVPVEMRELSQNVVVRGTVRSSDATALAAPSIEGATIITRLPKAAGDAIDEGDVAIEVAGRPMLVLEGELPAFRNLLPGLEGPDVRQLEAALVRLGHDPGPVDGIYDNATSAAVVALYTDLGYRPADASDTDQAALAAAKEAVSAQKALVADQEQALADASTPLKESERLELQQAVDEAQRNVSATDTAAKQAKASIADEVEAAAAAKDEAAQQAAESAERLRQAEAGTHPDDELAALRDAHAQNQTALTEASNTHETTLAVQAETIREHDGLVASAKGNLELAQARQAERLAPTDAAALDKRLAEAKSALADAEAELADAEAKVGAGVPVAELVFLPSLPSEVQSVDVEVGDQPADGPVMTVAGSESAVQATVSSADRRLIEVGAEATLEDDGLGLSAPAVVSFIADNPGGPDVADDAYAMRLEPTEPLPDDALNVNLRVSIPISSTGGEVLAVPFAALSAGPDGTARVEVERADGDTELVEVSTGLRAEGFVEVAAADLLEGDRVVVGQDLELPS